MTALIVALIVAALAITAVARWQKARKDGRPFLPPLPRGAHRATQAAQEAEDEQFWAYQATIAKKETWDRPPADLFPELHHEPPVGAGAYEIPDADVTFPPEPMPPAERAWPTHKAPLTGDIVAPPHMGPAPGALPVLVAQARIVLAAICDHVRQEADAAYLAERPELMPGHGYSDDTGSFAAVAAEWDREDAS